MEVCKTKYKVEIQPLTFCKYRLEVEGKIMELTFPQLLQLRQNLNEITRPYKLLKVIDNENFVLLPIGDKEHLLFLEIPKLLELKEKVCSYFNSF